MLYFFDGTYRQQLYSSTWVSSLEIRCRPQEIAKSKQKGLLTKQESYQVRTPCDHISHYILVTL